jgi:hypothetical protein
MIPISIQQLKSMVIYADSEPKFLRDFIVKNTLDSGAERAGGVEVEKELV